MTNEAQMVNLPGYPGTPLWVKVSGIAVGFVALLIVIMFHADGGYHHNKASVGSLDHHTAPKRGH